MYRFSYIMQKIPSTLKWQFRLGAFQVRFCNLRSVSFIIMIIILFVGTFEYTLLTIINYAT